VRNVNDFDEFLGRSSARGGIERDTKLVQFLWRMDVIIQKLDDPESTGATASLPVNNHEFSKPGLTPLSTPPKAPQYFHTRRQTFLR
jgi:hypothetical protein